MNLVMRRKEVLPPVQQITNKCLDKQLRRKNPTIVTLSIKSFDLISVPEL